MTRTCGTCHECCVQIPIPVLNKPSGKPCQHLCQGQTGSAAGCCSIYEQRPSECAAYTCAWLDGHLPDELKPDQSGILLEACWIDEPRKLTILAGFEHKPGAIEKYQYQIAEWVPEGTVVFLIPLDREEPLAIGAEGDLMLIQAFFAHCQKQGGIRHQMADGLFYQDLTKPPEQGLVQIGPGKGMES